jgi:hypothetical protein
VKIPSLSSLAAASLGLVVLLSLAVWPVSPVQASPTMVTDVTFVETPTELQVTVVASGPVQSKLVDLNPNWIVVDVQGAQLALSGAPQPIRRGLIQRVRLSQLKLPRFRGE